MSGITRVAPTPSGYLHVGNAVNFALTELLAERQGAAIALRLDDADAARYRTAYVEDVFAVLAWLEVRIDVGPADAADFEARYSQRRRLASFRRELDAALDRGLPAFACRCTRSQARAVGGEGCVAQCADAGYDWALGQSTLRAITPFGDVVLWRRDDVPGFNLVSIVEDRDLGTSLIVRGEDLAPTSRIQIYLAPSFDAHALADARFVHHRLITDNGHKLSKSQLRSGPMVRSDALRERVDALAQELLQSVV